jgi:transcriptional regulator
MYQVPQFREDDIGVMHAFVRAHPLGLLISSGPDGILANPIPFILHADEGERGMLRCHLSRGNPQGPALRENSDALIVFQGTQGYITPSWYPAKAEHGKVVPTWNYSMIQVRGAATLVDDPAWLLANVSALTAQHEGKRPAPWSVSDAPETFIASQLKGIIGIEIPIATIEGKFKASQNRAVPDRAGVAEGLLADGDASSLAMREMVKTRGGV